MKSKTLEEFIIEYNKGKISLGRLQEKLNGQMKSLEAHQERDTKRLTDTLILHYADVRSPEEMLIDEERMVAIVKLLDKLRTLISPKDWNIIYDLTIEPYRFNPDGDEDKNFKVTQTMVAKKYGITQQAVSKTLARVAKIAQENITAQEYDDCFVKE